MGIVYTKSLPNNAAARAKINPKSWNWEKSQAKDLGSNLDYYNKA
jgi:hypothetical protein